MKSQKPGGLSPSMLSGVSKATCNLLAPCQCDNTQEVPTSVTSVCFPFVEMRKCHWALSFSNRQRGNLMSLRGSAKKMRDLLLALVLVSPPSTLREDSGLRR